jgi:hypothetical protein
MVGLANRISSMKKNEMRKRASQCHDDFSSARE